MFLFNYLLTVLIMMLSENSSASDAIATKVYPVPPVNENSLFYIQRTKNTNAIVYEVNKNSEGKINESEPVKIYWIRYASDSTTDDLTPIQRKYAYGVTSRNYNGQKNSFVVQFVAYKKRNIFLLPTANGKHYSAFVSINGKLAELKKIFIATSGGSFWFPTIDYVELTGKDPATHQTVVERFHP
jgi:Domain of unknown function (DUF4833)